MRIVVDMYELSEKEMKEKDLYYKNRIVIYNSKIRELEDCALREENKDKYKIGQIIEE